MAKKVKGYIKLQIPAGKATPAPPVGPALGQHGVNIVDFTKQFNDRTANMEDVIPVVITVYADSSFSFITKTPPAAVLIKKAAGIPKASGEPNKKKVAKITKAQVQEIAEKKIWMKRRILVETRHFDIAPIDLMLPESAQQAVAVVSRQQFVVVPRVVA